MTKILIGKSNTEFQVIIPVYFRGCIKDFLSRIKQHSYEFDISGDEHAFHAESKHYTNEDKKPQLAVSISLSSAVSKDLGSNAVELMAKGSAAHSPVGENMMEELIQDLFLQELDFGVPEMGFDNVNRLHELYGRRHQERNTFYQFWTKTFEMQVYRKIIPYEIKKK